MTIWSKLLVFLVAGYLTLTRSFAHFGIPAADLYIGEFAIAAYLIFQTQNVTERWIAALRQPTRLTEFALAFTCFLVYGVFELIRAIFLFPARVLGR